MTDTRVIEATYSEIKMVKTRKVGQLVLEFPLEKFAEVVKRLGVPMPDVECWVAVALLEKPVATPTPNNVRSLNAKRAYADKDESHRAINRAGILARDPKFWVWVNKGVRGVSATQIVRNELDAAVYIRSWCDVVSRKDFAINPVACSKYLQLETEYRMGAGQMAENRG